MKKTPKLRFKEFNGDWDKTTLKQVTDSFEYGMNSASTEFDGENKYIRITDIDEKTNKYINTNVVSPLGELEDKYLVKENDILFARTGASTGKTYLYDKKDGKLYFAGFLIRANVNSDNNAKFMFLQTKTKAYGKWVKVMSMRSGQPGINSQEYASYSFNAPSKEEQKKIAYFFSLIDDKISLQREKVEALKDYRKGMTQKIFSQEIRFKDDNGESYPKWNKDKLINYTEKIITKNKGFIVTNVISNSAKNGLISQRDFFDKDIANQSNIDGYYVIEHGDFVYNPRKSSESPYGPINRYELQDAGVVSPLYLCFRINNKEINGKFLAYYFKSSAWHRFIYQNSDQGVRHDRVSIKDAEFFSMNIIVPKIDEQNKIVKFLDSLEIKLNKEQDKLDYLNENKKGLLQQMFI